MNWQELIHSVSLQEVLSGNIFRRGFFRRQYKLIALVALLLFVYIYNGFQCDSQQRRILQLQQQITEARYELLDISAEYTTKTRPSNIAGQLSRHNSKITESTTPPVMIK
ncbi:MAG: hypothetical protein IJV55_05710 [Paludibacteraceae bacterium]|nr:hypothetical protein [Paludibacteraceae bacterium]